MTDVTTVNVRVIIYLCAVTGVKRKHYPFREV